MLTLANIKCQFHKLITTTPLKNLTNFLFCRSIISLLVGKDLLALEAESRLLDYSSFQGQLGSCHSSMMVLVEGLKGTKQLIIHGGGAQAEWERMFLNLGKNWDWEWVGIPGIS